MNVHAAVISASSKKEKSTTQIASSTNFRPAIALSTQTETLPPNLDEQNSAFHKFAEA